MESDFATGQAAFDVGAVGIEEVDQGTPVGRGSGLRCDDVDEEEEGEQNYHEVEAPGRIERRDDTGADAEAD